MRLDLTGCESLRGQRDHHLVDAAQATLTLAHQLGVEAAVAVAGHVELDRADLGDHRLGAGPVAGVPSVAPGRVVAGVAEMLVHLRFQAGLEDLLGQIVEQPARAHELDPLCPGLFHQRFGQLGRGAASRRRRQQLPVSPVIGRARLGGSHDGHGVLPVEPQARPVRPTELHRCSYSPAPGSRLTWSLNTTEP